MARKYLVPIDLNQLELQNAVIQKLATAPSSPVSGQIYYDTAKGAAFYYNGSSWINMGGSVSRDTLSNRPAASAANANTLFYATDNHLLYVSDGSAWSQISAFGSGESTTVAIAGSAANGTSTNYARADHTHAGPGFGNVTAQTSYGASSGNGSATTVARSDHSHGTPAHTDTEHSGIHLSALAAPTADVAMGGYKLTNLANPSSAQDAATKIYVDNAVAGITWKPSVNLLAASNVALTGSTGTLVIDGHTALSATHNGYRLLLKGQSTDTENGIYTYADAGAGYTLSRASDADTYQELIGAAVFIQEGTTYGNTAWIQSNHYLTSFASQNWVQFAGTNVYTASNGVTVVNGKDFQFAPKTDGGLQTASNGASIKLQTNSGLGTTSNGLAVGAGTGISVSSGTVAIDTSVVARKYSTTIGNNSATTFTVTHSLGTTDVTVQIYTVADGTQVEADVTRSSTSAVSVAFAVAPTTNQYRVVVIG